MEPYGALFADEAEDDLRKLAKRDRRVYKLARSMIDLIKENPGRIGHPLDREWDGCQGVHFASDAYRIIWEVDDELGRISVLRVAPRGAQRRRGQLYDEPRPESPV